MATAFDIAAAVVTELNTGFPAEFTAERTPLPGAKLDELTDLKVSVVPKSMEPVQVTRGTRALDVTIDVGIQKKLGAGLEAEVESLCGLAERILKFFPGHALSEAPGAQFQSVVNDPIYDPEHLQQLRVFTSVVSVTYRI